MKNLYVGKKVNYLTILSMDKITCGKKTTILCRCECGNEKQIPINSLRTQRIRDCGCGTYMLQKYIGRKSGKLTVIDTFRKRYSGKVNIMCVCMCECGNKYTIKASEFNANKYSSCGCDKPRSNRLRENRLETNYLHKTYNGITIIGIVDREKKIVKCQCKCGNIFDCCVHDLTSGNPIIGCNKCPDFKGTKRQKFIRKTVSKYNILPKNALTSIYYFMKERCYNPNSKDYRFYGAKNIKICNQWLEDKDNFIEWALQNGYKRGLTIDRINSCKDYCPENCRWVDFYTQANNRKSNVRYFYNNEYLTLSQIARKYNLNENTLRSRIRQGIDICDAVEKPIRKRRN